MPIQSPTRVKQLISLIALCLLLSTSLSVRADSGSDRGIDSPAAILEALKKKKRMGIIRGIGDRMCSYMDRDSEVFVTNATRIVRKFMENYDKTPDVTNSKILEFLNENGEHMYCKLPFGGEEHYMVYARKKQFTTKVFTKFLDKLSVGAYDSDGKKLVPSVNFVVGKSPSGDLETYLDFLQREASEISYSKKLRSYYQTMADRAVRMYGAKTYMELSGTSQ